ncbi:CopG family transcriptional regulator [Demequina sp.]|uniref:CopG family transcriptional regulator n=1 Tax=Demequina sp. TaxID=2050685 RepID=UPI0025B85BAE|nr:CopG family transcriptional regulator [Demequina sp.]
MAMTLRTDPEFEAALAFLAQHDNGSKQEAVRRAVMERAARLGHQDRVAALSAESKDRWAETLNRLGTV